MYANIHYKYLNLFLTCMMDCLGLYYTQNGLYCFKVVMPASRWGWGFSRSLFIQDTEIHSLENKWILWGSRLYSIVPH